MGALLCLAVLITAAPPAVWGHRVNIFAWIEGDKVHTESKFSGGREPKNARVTVYDMNGAQILQGVTDENGFFSFKPDKWQAMRIVLTAGQGHQGEWRITEKEITAEGLLPDSTAHPAKPRENPAPENNSRSDSPEPQMSSETVAAIKAIVENTVEKKTTPILRQLKRMEEHALEPQLKDIAGGIGYIFGLVGVAAYMNARRREKKR